MLALLVAAALADSFRPPEDQWAAQGYKAAVEGYRWVKPRCGLKGCCRFSPSCSHYSSAAVERYGIWRGLGMSYERIRRCQPGVPAGTSDPVPGGVGLLEKK